MANNTNHQKARTNSGRFDARRKTKFIEALAKTRNVSLAAKAVGIGRGAAYRHRKEDEDFRERWDATFETAVDDLEQSALDRAINGWEEPVFHQGEVVGHVRKFSNALTIFMLKAWRRERYLFEQQVVENADEVAEKLRKALANMDASIPEDPGDDADAEG